MKQITPPPATISKTDEIIIQSLAKLDVIALGISVGIIFGLIIFLATNILVLKGGENIGQNLSLLNNYFIGYEVTPIGSISGFFWGFASGFVIGSMIAFLRNFIVTAYVFLLRLKGNLTAVNDYIDNP